MRISIKKHNQAYLESLASQMGITDISEVLNYLLLDIKGLNYQFGNKAQPTPAPQQAPIGYAFDPTTFEKVAPAQECVRNYSQDPIIARMASLIEDF